jgi:mercuric ion transport protein
MVIEHCFLDMRLDSVADYGSNLNAVIHAMKGATVMSESKSGCGSLFAGGVAAILASACCLGPLVLITLGISGAWIGNLAALEPFRPWFIGAALVAMIFAWRRIYRPAEACQPGEICAVPQVRTAYKVVFWIVALLILTALAFPFVLPLFY